MITTVKNMRTRLFVVVRSFYLILQRLLPLRYTRDTLTLIETGAK